MSLNPGGSFCKMRLLSSGEGQGSNESGAAQGGAVATDVVMFWDLLSRSCLRNFVDARLNNMPTRLLLSRTPEDRSFLWDALTGEEEDPTREENAVVTCWKTSSCLKRSEGDRGEDKEKAQRYPRILNERISITFCTKTCTVSAISDISSCYF